ncbi:hypothetical protein CP983_05580 [Streptomyces chartreusis]|nr:hypothetical protein CP983_05580 [Streptomyces chartreusis]
MELERAAVTAHTQLHTADDYPAARAAWLDAAAAFQAAVTTHAAAEGSSRYEVEMAVKKAVRHPETVS